MKKYFMIHNPEAKFMPRVQHEIKESAVTEAKRLASVSPGTAFIILEATEAYRVETPEPTKICMED